MNHRPPAEHMIDVTSAIEAVGQAVIITAVDGTVLFWNRAAGELYGWGADEVLGRSIMEVTPADQTREEAAAVFARLQRGERWSGDIVLQRRDGSTFVAAVADTPVLDDAGEVVAVIGVSEDVTARRWAEDALQRSEQRLRLALEAGRLGVWAWDPATAAVSWDRAMERIFGLEEGTAPTSFEDYAALLHPDERDDVVATFAHALAEGTSFTVEHRVVRPDGSVRWVQGDGRPVRDGDRTTGLIGVTVDVTARHEAEAERARLLAEEAAALRGLEAARNRLQFLADATAAMSEPFELPERLERLARLCVPRFADISAIYLVDDAGAPALIALHHRDPARQGFLRDLVERFPARLDAPVGVGVAIRTGRTAWLETVTDDMLALASQSDEHLAEVRRLGVTAGVAVPLVGPDGPFGAVAFLTVGGRSLSGDDVALAEELCARIAVTVYNGQLVQARELDRAAQRQQAALLQSVFEASVDGMLAVDPAGNVLAHNQRFLDLWGFDRALTGDGDAALLAAAAARVVDPDDFLDGVRRAYASSRPALHDEVVLRDGRVLDRHGTRIVDDDGRYLGFTWSFRDVTGERAQQAEVAAVGERFATLARTLQQSLLPPSLPAPVGVELAARYHPAFEGVDVGGDFYDVFAVGDDWLLVIGDVCGKGAEAASLTALARYTIRAAAIHNEDVAATLAELNTAMLAHAASSGLARRFATVCCMRLRTTNDGAVVQVACGGHPLPVVLRADGTTEPGGTPGTLLGVFETVELVTTTTTLRPGDTLVAVTDGVLEARDAAGGLLDTHGLERLLGRLGRRSADEIGAAIEAEALAVQSGTARDDIAVLVARIL